MHDCNMLLKRCSYLAGHKRDWEDVPESGIEGEFKRDDAADEEARLEDVIQYLR